MCNSESCVLPLGFLNINKPKGMTSHDVVACLRRITKIKQIGHSGTLDPFATGVLPVAIGKATRLIEYLDDDKEYLATVQFGKNTDTYDIDGQITQVFDKKVTKDELIAELENFKGEILQYPPVYSAIKVNGKKLYEYARAGQEVNIEPRRVFISKLELKSFDYENQSAEILVGCSKGTYIRSIAFDLGKNMETGAYLSNLIRTKAGKFTINSSVNLDDLSEKEDVSKHMIAPLEVISYPVYQLNEDEKNRVMHGMSIFCNISFPRDIVFLVYSGKIYAVGKVEQNKILVKKVFEVL